MPQAPEHPTMTLATELNPLVSNEMLQHCYKLHYPNWSLLFLDEINSIPAIRSFPIFVCLTWSFVVPTLDTPFGNPLDVNFIPLYLSISVHFRI